MLKTKFVGLTMSVVLAFVMTGCGSKNHQFWYNQMSPELDSGFAMIVYPHVGAITIRDASGTLTDNCGLLNSKCDMSRQVGLTSFQVIKRTFSKFGQSRAEIFSLPPGRYYLQGWGSSYFKNEKDMPVIEVRPHEVTLFGEITAVQVGAEKKEKLFVTPEAKRKIVEMVKWELQERTDNDAKDVAIYKSWLPALEKAASLIQ